MTTLTDHIFLEQLSTQIYIHRMAYNDPRTKVNDKGERVAAYGQDKRMANAMDRIFELMQTRLRTDTLSVPQVQTQTHTAQIFMSGGSTWEK